MDCREYELLISRLVDRELDAVAGDALRAHMAECAACRHFYEAAVSLDAGLKHLSDAVVVPTERCVQRFARQRRVFHPSSGVASWVRVPAMAALVLMAVGLGHMAGTALHETIAPLAMETADMLILESGPSFADVAMQLAYEEPER